MNILFICTGNYYRSRFAEIYFNHLVAQEKLTHRAFSRGLEVFKGWNIGNISPNTVRWLERQGVPLPELMSEPQQIQDADFTEADLVIALDESEHKPMMQQYFPAWAENIVYWNFEDVQFVNPNQMLPELEKKIILFVKDLKPKE